MSTDSELTEELAAAVKARIRTQTSPRHVPDDVIAVPGLPHTRTGKRLEVPVKRLIQGHPLDAVAGAGAVDDFAARYVRLISWRRSLMITSRPGSGRPCPGSGRMVMVPVSPLGRVCPHHFDKATHRNVRPARRLTFPAVALSDR